MSIRAICRPSFAIAARNISRARRWRQAAWNDVVIEGDDVDLTKLPITLQFAVDGAPYITAGQISARDTVSGVDTTGFHRLMLKGKNRLGVSLHSRRRMYEFHRRAEERGKSLPAVITIGTHPLHYMGSMVYAYPPKTRKFEIIGGLFGEPYRLAQCGVDDLEVPAGAEIVIEGEILAGVHEPEGPFGEFTGYASYRSTQNVFVAKRVRMRGDAIYQAVTSGMSKDHILVSCITREGEILNALRRNLPNVRAVHVPHTTCGAFMAFISMKKTADGEPQMAAMATFGTEMYTKYVIVVDDDVDVFDVNDVMWAVATRVRAEKDIFFVPGAKAAILDPDIGPAEFHRDEDGYRCDPPGGPRFCRAACHHRGAACARAENPRHCGIKLVAGQPAGRDDLGRFGRKLGAEFSGNPRLVKWRFPSPLCHLRGSRPRFRGLCRGEFCRSHSSSARQVRFSASPVFCLMNIMAVLLQVTLKRHGGDHEHFRAEGRHP